MDFLGVGPLELVFILILVLIIFGPNDIVRAGKSLGKFMRRVVTSDGWKAFQQARRGISDLPTQLMREAGLEEEDLRQMSGLNDFDKATRDIQNQISPWTTPPTKLSDNPVNPVGEPTLLEVNDPEAKIEPSELPKDAEPQEPPPPPPGSPFSQTIDDNKS